MMQECPNCDGSGYAVTVEPECCGAILEWRAFVQEQNRNSRLVIPAFMYRVLTQPVSEMTEEQKAARLSPTVTVEIF